MADIYLTLVVFFGLREAYEARMTDYCKVKCEDGVHTMCTKYYPPGGVNCSDFQVYITAKEISDIVDEVNRWRNSVALGKLFGLPSASNMIELHWDEEAASIATRWAEQCNQQAEDSCRKLLLTSRDDGGQCIAGSAFRGHLRSKFVHESIEYFFTLAEKLTDSPDSMDSIDIYRPTADEVKYFTQMAWAQTDRIGCAISERHLGEGDAKYKFICNLYAAGNIAGRSVYLRGKPCSACPEKYSSCSDRFPGLCTYNPKARSRSSHLQSLLTEPLSSLLFLVSVIKMFDFNVIVK